MALTKEEIISAIKEMNVVDLADLVKSLEDEFGVTAAAPVAVAAAPAGGEAAAPGGKRKRPSSKSTSARLAPTRLTSSRPSAK